MSAGLNNKLIRCAIYTRKSHEEGLEQEFNSLDAQRESAEAYIKSQLHEGWQLIKTKYDDGGFSGGNMKRPALTKLLDDIRYNKIDIVVVYKVDRLSRSLSDFSRLIELFDEHKVSFVSVTQQFNTSNSMGRLTLNMLLSFAQFEREVTGERIRDKIEASKKKGLWMGGNPPMGYKAQDRKLIVIPEEAGFVRQCFIEYLKAPSILNLAETFNGQGYRTKQWVSNKGINHGGKRLTPKYLYRILVNPIYQGKITHKGKAYEGEHEPIIDEETWNNVQGRLQKTKPKLNTKSESPYLLKGILKHHEGYSMSPSTFRKKHKDGTVKETRYYVSQKAIKEGYKTCDVKSINAEQIESIVVAMLAGLFEQSSDFHLYQIEGAINQKINVIVLRLIKRISISTAKLVVQVCQDEFEKLKARMIKQHNNGAGFEKKHRTSTLLERPIILESEKELIVSLDIDLKQTSRARMVVSSNGKPLLRLVKQEPNPYILKALSDAYRWRDILDDGKSPKQLAKEECVNYSLMLRKLQLLNLAPDIQKKLLTGKLGRSLQLKALLNHSINLRWERQRKQMEFFQ